MEDHNDLFAKPGEAERNKTEPDKPSVLKMKFSCTAQIIPITAKNRRTIPNKITVLVILKCWRD